MINPPKTAKLYAFPTGSRLRPELAARVKPVADRAVPRTARVEFGSGWYHDAAIRDAEQPRKP